MSTEPLFEYMQYVGAAPTKAYDDDAGFDLATEGHHIIEPHGFASIPLQTRLLAPPGHWILMVGRSSAFKNLGLLVNIGVIDPSYTGPLFAVCRNLTGDPIQIAHGDRIAQAIPILNHGERIVPLGVQDLPVTGRGANGFGSSGS